jgi:serine/threonine-protein phosphatase 2A activator
MHTLSQISLSSLPSLPLPTLHIRTDADVEAWKSTTGYRDFGVWVRLLNESVVGVEVPSEEAGEVGVFFLLYLFF